LSSKRAPSLADDDATLVEGRPSRAGNEEVDAQQVAALLAGLGDGTLHMEETIGRGGMGVVYLATQPSLGRRVAVKQLREEHLTPPATLKLLREAWVTGALEHPNIVPVYDLRLGAGGQPQIVLKRIDGVPWSDLVGDAWAVSERFGSPDLLEHNLDVLMQVSRAVHFAHSRGVVHRDLKPANVMIGLHGEIYLLDWGVAVSMRADPDGRLPLACDSLEIAGTPGYMAPELLLGQQVSERTDVYLLGAILHEILTGEPPHRGSTPEEVTDSVLRSTPEQPAGVVPELWAIVTRAMQARAEERYDSAKAFGGALADCRKRMSALHLAAEAELRLQALLAVAASKEPAAARRAEAYELYGGARFGFRQALVIWSEHASAQRGIERAVEAMVELELECSEPAAAAELLAELSRPPPELARRVREATEAAARERRRLADLEQLGAEQDAALGARTRRVLVAVLGFSWTLAPVATALAVDPVREAYPPLVVAPVVVLAGLAGLTLWGRRVLFSTAINRGVVATIAMGLLAQLALALAAPWMQLDGVQARTAMLLLWALVVAMAAATIDRRLAWSAAAFLIAFGACAALATNIAQVLYAMAASYFVVSVNALAIWRPRAADPPSSA
jgi:serine/threonine-protein kinase